MTDVNYSAITSRYHLLPQNEDNVLLRYIWLDGNGYDLRTKSSQTNVVPKSLEEVPLWLYCGQTCGHMRLTADSDCWLKPVLLCNDPFRAHNNKLVFCVPIKYEIEASVYRHSCEAAVNKLDESKIPLFTIRQPYFLTNALTKRPIGWPFDGFPASKGSYCRIGSNKAIGRDINEAFYKACLYAGIPINSTQSGDLPSIWSFEIGPSRGITIADQLWMARYILHYIGEEFNSVISFDPKPLPDVELAQNMTVGFDSITNKTFANSSQSKSRISDNSEIKSNQMVSQITTGNEFLQEMSFASNADPYVAVESIINTLIE